MRILSVILLLIAYGSLYPGNFSDSAGRLSKRVSDQFQCFYFDRGSAREYCALFSPGNRRHFVLFGKAARRDSCRCDAFACVLIFARPPTGASLAAISLRGARRCALEYGGYGIRHGSRAFSCERGGQRHPLIAFGGACTLLHIGIVAAHRVVAAGADAGLAKNQGCAEAAARV